MAAATLPPTTLTDTLADLSGQLDGDLFYDDTMRALYATDASAYREMPLAVAVPRHAADIGRLVRFARERGTSLIPRAAGTSLAGQVVGRGIVVDISQHFGQILALNAEEGWVRVQPGVVRDELNMFLKEYGLFFGPETSTANRAMIGGMVGNNSCGSNSVVYGSTREHVLSAEAVLSDGTTTTFGPLSRAAFAEKCNLEGLEGDIYRHLRDWLADPDTRAEIRREFPKPEIPRRNTGYAVDLLLDNAAFDPDSAEPFNLCRLLAGSEGTLAFLTEVTLRVVPLPPPHKALVCAHFETVDDSLRANLIALKYQPTACELMDHHVLERTKDNIEQRQNRFFVQGDPAAILVVELSGDDADAVSQRAAEMEAEMRAAGLGYHFPVVTGADIGRVWTLRKAGLGLLSNMPGDAKPAPVIEDTAVAVEDLPAYIRDFNKILRQYDLYCVHYAHAGSGELHLRPILNLKTEEGQAMFRTIAEEIARLVKKYRGSLSGEHGDGRLRAEFLRFMIGERNYELMRRVKYLWDPTGVFNPRKIVDAPPMDTNLRFAPGQQTRTFDTVFRFEREQGILRAAEQCNGSGDCRKTELTGGTMCPSYMATRRERDTTRARANILREVLTRSDAPNPFASEAIHDVMDLCLSCKGCKSECPSNVDVGKMKAEFLHQYYQTHGVPLRARLVAGFARASALASLLPAAYNALFSHPTASRWFKRAVGFAPDRSMPLLHQTTLRRWYRRHRANRFGVAPLPLTECAPAAVEAPAETTLVGTAPGRVTDPDPAGVNHPGLYPPDSHFARSNGSTAQPGVAQPGVAQPNAAQRGTVYLFCDEFTNYNDTPVGVAALKLLTRLGYDVEIPQHAESGRAHLSKGLLADARRLANRNVRLLRDLVYAGAPLVGIEPSALLSFRDEYPDLVEDRLRPAAEALAEHCLLFDEFIAREIDAGRLHAGMFTEEARLIKLHGHCHQKALSTLVPTKKMLSLPKNHEVHLIRSGCCGMAGSFGYEREHYDLSMQIGELVLFPTVRQQPSEVTIAAPGTSCRHQIKDGTGRQALHPIEILYQALK